MPGLSNGEAFVTITFERERERRELLNDLFKSLMSLLPNPTGVLSAVSLSHANLLVSLPHKFTSQMHLLGPVCLH